MSMGYQEDLRQDRSRGLMLALAVVQTAFYLLILPSLMVRLSGKLDASLPGIPFPVASSAVGAVLVLLSLYVMIRAFLVLSYVGKDWPGGQTAYIVDKDIYEFVRHPLFWGYTLFWAGVGLRGRSLGHRFLTHPLAGGARLNETPYRSVFITDCPVSAAVDFESLRIIEGSMAVMKGFGAFRLGRIPPHVDYDYQLIDFALMESAMESL
jgi:protein-S-isoprenylcysteine O-methyltransferase Ste14